MLNQNSQNTSSHSDCEFPNFDEFVSSFSSSQENEKDFENEKKENEDPFSNIDINTILKLKQILDSVNSKKNNPRSNLLLSLKPYVRPERKDKIDQYIKLLNMENIIENLKNSGGEIK